MSAMLVIGIRALTPRSGSPQLSRWKTRFAGAAHEARHPKTVHSFRDLKLSGFRLISWVITSVERRCSCHGPPYCSSR